MAIAFVREAAAENQDTLTPTATLSVAATAGHLLVTCLAVDKNATSITAPSGFTIIQSYISANVSGAMAYKIAAGGETSVQWTVGAYSNGCAVWVGQYSGIHPTPLDQSTENDSSTSAVTSLSTGTTSTTVQAVELAVAMCAIDSGTTVSGWSNGFSSEYNTANTSNPGAVFVGTKILSATGTQTSTFTWTNADQAYAAIATFKGDNVALTVADAGHAHAVDNLALTQHNILVIQDATHSHAADNVVLTAHASGTDLVIQDSTHAQTADNLALTQHNVLAIQDAAHGHTADNLNLTQHNVLAIQDAAHAHVADNLALTQHNILVIQDATHAHTVDSPILTQHNILVIQDGAHAHAADNLALIQHNILAIQDGMHLHATDNLTLVLAVTAVLGSVRLSQIPHTVNLSEVLPYNVRLGETPVNEATQGKFPHTVKMTQDKTNNVELNEVYYG